MTKGAAATSGERLSILVVDDDPDIVMLITTALRGDYNVVGAYSGQEALEELDKESVAAVVADHMMPGMTGVELLDRVHSLQPAAARVLVTASERVDVLRDAVNLARVHRFVSKPLRVAHLPNLLAGAIREAQLEVENTRLVNELEAKNRELSQLNERLEIQVQERTRELRAAVDELETLALRDGLTGLFNHRYFQEALVAELARAQRHGHSMGLLFVDVDHFKRYNDTHGHPAGDRLLKRLAGALTGGRDSGLPSTSRASDIPARYGGEEFVLILPETGLEGCLVKAERLRSKVAAFEFEGRDSQPGGLVSVSIGIAVYPDHGKDNQALIAEADRQLYRAKAAGRNCVAAASLATPKAG